MDKIRNTLSDDIASQMNYHKINTEIKDEDIEELTQEEQTERDKEFELINEEITDKTTYTFHNSFFELTIISFY